MNSLTLTGRLVKEVEVRTTEGGKSYCKFTLAAKRTKEVTDFIPCVAWGKTSEFIKQYFVKGDGIEIQGQVQSGKYKNKEGVEVYTLEIFVNKASFGTAQKRKQNQTNTAATVQDDDFPF